MYNERFKQWVHASFGVASIVRSMPPTLQGLGLLDCQLIAEDMQHLQLSEEALNTIGESEMVLSVYHNTLSYLWVLGAYEVVRTIDQRCRDDTGLLDEELRQHVRDLKYKLERLRIPLAKFEPARRHPDDSPIAYLAVNRIHGTAWQIAPDTFITRREISDALLQLLTEMRAYTFQSV